MTSVMISVLRNVPDKGKSKVGTDTDYSACASDTETAHFDLLLTQFSIYIDINRTS